MLISIYNKHIANIILNGERLNTFPLRSATRQAYLLSSLLFNIVVEVLDNAINKKKKKKNRAVQIVKDEVKLR